MPVCKGRLIPDQPLSKLTWLRVGGAADWLFQPTCQDDLSGFLRSLDSSVPVFPMGVGSNLIVRDGGIRGVVIRLGREFSDISFTGTRARSGAAALDSRVAVRAMEQGLDLAFLRTIPGTIGGAVRMNAGCYGTYMADVVRSATIVERDGSIRKVDGEQLGFGYRSCRLPADAVIVEAELDCPEDEPAAIAKRLQSQIKRRDTTQPTKAKTAGSTFRNPAGYSSTGEPDDVHDLKAWKLIDEAGMRGVTRGAAMVSPLHPNFLVNTGGATATDIEQLALEVRERVFSSTGIRLEWELIRIGDPENT